MLSTQGHAFLSRLLGGAAFCRWRQTRNGGAVAPGFSSRITLSPTLIYARACGSPILPGLTFGLNLLLLDHGLGAFGR
jgi:hypothetical protein